MSTDLSGKPDYYETLCVSRSADASTIRKAYRRIARKVHPDRGGNAEDFKRLSEAYEVLNDPDRRAQYDLGGQTRTRPRVRHIRKCKPAIFHLRVSLSDLYTGLTRRIRISRTVISSSATPNVPVEGDMRQYSLHCGACNGSGSVRLRITGMVHRIRGPCPSCGGTGYIMQKGYVSATQSEIIEIKVDKGMSHGDKIQLVGKGEMRPGCTPGDVVCVIVADANKTFQRHKDDLLIHLDIGLFDALGQASVSFKHLDGRQIELRAPESMVISPDIHYRVSDLGMPILDTCEYGDLRIVFNVVFPRTALTPAKKRELRELLAQDIVNHVHTDTVTSTEAYYITVDVTPPTVDATDVDEGGRPGCAQQ